MKKLNNLPTITQPRSKHWQSDCKSVLAPITFHGITCSAGYWEYSNEWDIKSMPAYIFMCTFMHLEMMGSLYKTQ